MSYYLKSSCRNVDIEALLSYVAALKDLELLMEAVEIIKHMMETPGDNKDKLFQLLAGTVWLTFFCFFFTSSNYPVFQTPNEWNTS